ncbi:uncharacterized protein B0T15DRAFT_149329 [Chaetomium strumarium]|uniref:Uncharacterized protein n=1 Tax=Chaetomium strumarium TaxID=1170767 RepID=A0AAJ0M2I5_9PEZI|nr:hypothetical protein B0T15DRAFT_149329 [Chaetomium strumarium]
MSMTDTRSKTLASMHLPAFQLSRLEPCTFPYPSIPKAFRHHSPRFTQVIIYILRRTTTQRTERKKMKETKTETEKQKQKQKQKTAAPQRKVTTTFQQYLCTIFPSLSLFPSISSLCFFFFLFFSFSFPLALKFLAFLSFFALPLPWKPR